MAILYILSAVQGGLILAFREQVAMAMGATEPEDMAVTVIYGIAMIAVSLALVIFYGVAVILRRSRAAWVYGIVALIFGILGCLLFCVPMLIFWVRRDTRAYFFE